MFSSMHILIAAQPSLSGTQRQGDNAYEHAEYRSAAKFYQQAGIAKGTDKAARLRYAISLYEINDIDGALNILQALVNEGKVEPEVFFYLARNYESRNLFQEAINYYKRFLQRSKPDDPKQVWVKDQLVRCANGLRLKYADESAYVENAGSVLNTQYDEFGIKNSPTTLGKIYFSSNRDFVQTGKLSTDNVDIYNSVLVNGQWSSPAPLPQHINSTPYEEVCGFSTDGQILYYLVQPAAQLVIRTDTFSEQTGKTHKGYFNGPFDINRDGTDLTFSMIRFAYLRPIALVVTADMTYMFLIWLTVNGHREQILGQSLIHFMTNVIHF